MWCVPMTPGSWKIGSSTAPAPPGGSPAKTSRPARIPFSRTAFFERRLVDDLGARRVDEEGAGPHGREELRADHSPRLRLQRDVHAHDVGVARDLGRRRRAIRSRAPPPLRGVRLRLQATTGIPNARARGTISRPIPPVPIRPSVRPKRPSRLAVLLLVPDAALQVRGVVRDPAVEREHQPEGELRHRDRVLARAVGDVDAALGGGLDVDRVVARRPRGRRARAGPPRAWPASLSSIGRRGPPRPSSPAARSARRPSRPARRGPRIRPRPGRRGRTSRTCRRRGPSWGGFYGRPLNFRGQIGAKRRSALGVASTYSQIG